MCEDCGATQPSFGLAAEGTPRWCGGCAKVRAAAQSPCSIHPALPLPPLCPLPSRGCPAVHPLPPPLSQKPELKPERVAAQKAIDGVLVPIIKKTPLMDGYLKTLFSLSKADVPHKMKF